jgi:hypothetical protein
MGWSLWELDLERLVPTDEDRAAGAEVLDALAEECDGPIFSPYAAWLPAQVGQPPSTPLIALWDLQHDEGPLADRVPRLVQAAKEHHWACVLEGGMRSVGYRIQEHYTTGRRLELPPRALMPKTGWRVRPREILVPRTEER